MSLNPRADLSEIRRAKRRWFNPRSLRVRILVVFFVQFALMFLLVGTITTLTLHNFQIDQLDKRLAAADRRFREPPERLPQEHDGPSQPGGFGSSDGGFPDGGSPSSNGGGTTGLDDLFRAFQGPGTIGAQIVNGKVVVAGILAESGAADLPTSQYSVLLNLPDDGSEVTRDLGDFGEYRLVANRVGHSVVRVTGLPMGEVRESQYRLILIEVIVGLAGLVISTVAGAAVIRVALTPLTRVARTATRVSRLKLHEGEVGPLVRVPKEDTDPRSEAGQVGAAFNSMLDHVEAALASRQASETRLRQFVADASHELRTPLAAIRGYAELTHRHRGSTPPQVSDAIERVEAAAGRMTTLVEDLLLLARLDARRPLAREQVDLSAMVIEAVTDAHVAGPAHRWLLDVPEDSVTTVGDASRLHQVLANLLANARTHTPDGTTVTVGLRVFGDRIAMRVVDDGPGIPEHLMPTLFERFARGDSSRSRATGSTGLGLAIVAAVTAAHGGEVEVSSVPGNTAFVIWLPATADPQVAHGQG